MKHPLTRPITMILPTILPTHFNHSDNQNFATKKPPSFHEMKENAH